ncbi:MAG TPA: hypothetical protein PLH55_09460, partial [Spirochaetales bacterium]|nr:hypothetical protein [Spirochaetales bacterium]
MIHRMLVLALAVSVAVPSAIAQAVNPETLPVNLGESDVAAPADPFAAGYEAATAAYRAAIDFSAPFEPVGDL